MIRKCVDVFVPVDEKLELGLAAPLEQRHHQGPVAKHLPHHHLLQVQHLGHLLLHVLGYPDQHVAPESLQFVHLFRQQPAQQRKPVMLVRIADRTERAASAPCCMEYKNMSEGNLKEQE